MVSEPQQPKPKCGRSMESKNHPKATQPGNKELPKTVVLTPMVFFHPEPELVLTYNLDLAKK